jgi:hypothetical protein
MLSVSLESARRRRVRKVESAQLLGFRLDCVEDDDRFA